MGDYVQTGCLILGILCFFYYFIIVTYAGITADFAWIWAAAGIIFLGVRRLLASLAFYSEETLRWAEAVCAVCMAAGFAAGILMGSRIVRAMAAKPQRGLDYVIVLGAQVRGSVPSRALQKRLDCAAGYASENPDTILILSGGKGSGEDISEALCMHRYLTGKGIPADRLVMEARSASTWENLKFSSELLDPAEKRVGILSNNFHIYRALRIAKKAGYRNASGIPAPSDPVMQLHYVVREMFAVMSGIIRRQI